jgi:adsorption protein B
VTHGVYCDEFAEYQTKDVPARQALGGFLPSNGVGTAYARWALERVAAAGRPFDDRCLTEDYDTGYRLRKLGFRQLFIPIHRRDGELVATREYFPARARDALKQRTRWVIGIALQGWERHGWGRGWSDAYWFWRDRKGLIGNPASLLANALAIGISLGWALGQPVPPGTSWFAATLALQCFGLGFRIYCGGRIYGWPFAAGAAIRAFWANWLNAWATVCAIARYSSARLRNEPLAWTKTDHVYPEAVASGSVAAVDAHVAFGEIAAPEARDTVAAAVDHEADVTLAKVHLRF